MLSRINRILPKISFEMARRPPGPAEKLDTLRRTFRRHRPPIFIKEFVGSGGFSDVFTAVSDYYGDREFAIKILRPELLTPRKGPGIDSDREEMRIKDIKKRFTNESYVQWDLSQHLSDRVSQSIVRVYDHGEFDDRHGYRFILMERMESTLRSYMMEHVNDEPTPAALRHKVMIMTKIADIIFNVHQEGIIHRDIKPENIFFPPCGSPTCAKSDCARRAYEREINVKLGDFGTVRWIRMYTDAFDGVIIGSQWYLSPEQIFNPEHLDTRTDIYSFGVVCYELLYGTHPKNLNADTANLLEKLAWAKPEQRTPPEGFERLNEIIFRCMEEVDQRYQSMAEVVRDLRLFLRRLG